MIKNKKFLITGAGGQLAGEFISSLEQRGLSFFAPPEDKLDITDNGRVRAVMGEYKPDVLLNCAAYNLVDKAEEEPEKVFKINSEAVENLAAACKDLGVFMVHFSSDYVFDGQKGDLYTEEDPTNPLNVYGESKLKGEEAVRQALEDFLIFRLSWVFGAGRQNFLYKLLQWAGEKDNVQVVSDEISAPTYTKDVVDAVILALEKGLEGTFHLTNSGKCSRYEWTKYYFKKIKNLTPITPIRFEEILSATKRPKFSAMSNGKISRALKIELPHWMDAVDRFVVDYPQKFDHKVNEVSDVIKTKYPSKIFDLLDKQQKSVELINVAVLGCGWFGSGLLQELAHWPSIRPKVVFEQNVERAVDALISSGISKRDIVIAQSVADFNAGLKGNGKHVIARNLEFISDLRNIQAVFDTTGNILAGAKAAMMSFEKGIHFITVSSELDSTIGPILNKKAQEKGVIYSNSDGDQPGVLGRLISEVKSFGFSIEVAGNCKGFLDVHKTPDDIMPWVKPGQNPKMITAFTDGSKQSMEMTVVANAFGLSPDVRGMHGLTTTKAALVKDFMGAISSKGIVDYCLGINGIDQGAGVFVIGKKEGKRVQEDMKYLKKGDGPYYLFFRDHHLCYIEAPRSIFDVVIDQRPTIAPSGHYVDVFAVAKRSLKVGERLDGIGGYMIYGLIEKVEITKKQGFLPLGLAEYAMMKRTAEKDDPITLDVVEFEEDNLVLDLYREQDRMATNVSEIVSVE